MPTPSKGGTLRSLSTDSANGRQYIAAMNAAANYAFVNRHFMTALVRANVRHQLGQASLPILYDVPHNMAKREEGIWVHRKRRNARFSGVADERHALRRRGATRSHSRFHGHGQLRARGHRRRRGNALERQPRSRPRPLAIGGTRGKKASQGAVSDQDFARSMEGIELIAQNRYTVKEEAPAAYKDIDAVIESVVGAGLARAVARMVPLAVLKG